MLQIVVDQPTVADNSVDPATLPSYYALPSVSALAARHAQLQL